MTKYAVVLAAIAAVSANATQCQENTPVPGKSIKSTGTGLAGTNCYYNDANCNADGTVDGDDDACTTGLNQMKEQMQPRYTFSVCTDGCYTYDIGNGVSTVAPGLLTLAAAFVASKFL